MAAKLQKMHTIGVLPGWEVYENANLVNYLGPLLYGIQSAAKEAQCNLLLACGMGSPGGQLGVVEPAWPVPSADTLFVPVGPYNTDGLIVIHPLVSEVRAAYVNSLMRKGRHVVFVGTGMDRPAVAIDNRGGIQRAIDHLVKHGHSRIAFIAGSPNDPHGDSEERLNGFYAAMQVHGLDVDPGLVAYGLHIVEGGRLAMQQILDDGAPFTAVLGSSDECAIGAMEILRKTGRRIPEDVAVIGFDDSPEAAIQDPPLTSIHSPTFERGRRALQLILEHVAGKEREKKLITVPTRLTIRKSCGCDSWEHVESAHSFSAPAVEAAEPESSIKQLCRDMTEAVLNNSHRLSSTDVEDFSRKLISAFISHVNEPEGEAFFTELKKAIQHGQSAGEDAYAWRAGISVLRRNLPSLFRIEGIAAPESAEESVNLAFRIISEAAELQHQKILIEQQQVREAMAALTAHLFISLNEPQIFAVLSERFSEMGIPHAAMVLFESQNDGPGATSLIRVVPGTWEKAKRFFTNEFPPASIYPPSQPYSLALVPLVVRNEQLGFIAFESSRLDLFGAIVLQLDLALQDAELYREADAGRRLAEEGRRMAETADQLKSRFLSMVSHELRTPLMVISGLSERLLEDDQIKAISANLPKEYLARIHASAQHLDGLIRDVLDLSQNQVGQLRLTCEPLDLAEIITSASSVGKELAEEKGLAWRLELPKRLPQIWGDRTRLRQVLLNLIHNAVKFTEKGEVRIRAESRNNFISLSVSDTGLGIPREDQGTIFDEFKQSGRTSKRGFGGLGLGLAISKQLIEMHGGTIRVESSGEEGLGSSFIIQLPALKKGRTGEPENPRTTDTNLVLVISSNSLVGTQIRQLLLQKGFNIELGDIQSEQAWLARLRQHHFSAVLMDTDVNPERGWALLKSIKENPATRDIPVLFYSLSLEENTGALLSLDTLTKPLTAHELDQALKFHGISDIQKGNSVLVADDEPTILEIHAQILQAAAPHLGVLKARDGKEALAMIRKEKPALVLLDLLMPEMDGFAVLEAMQNDHELANIPVVVLTGQTLTSEEMLRLNHGVAAVLSKGVYSVAETIECIVEVLGRAPGLRGEKRQLARNAMACIHEHYSEPITRHEIAAQLSVSEDHLSRCFHQETGLTITAYLRRFRVLKAKEMLAAEGTNMTQIAMALGFPDSNYFSREFRKETGISPSAFRRRSHYSSDG